ncbi:MAG: carbohydrate ABC transporter permease [Spirochaetes bacterium]|nr:carbohydrate ABC transporter permease [Spirochaetota bacterium]
MGRPRKTVRIPSSPFGGIFVKLLLIVLTIIFLMPLYWMVSGSFKLQSITMSVPPEFFPAKPTLANWTKLLNGSWPIWNWLRNSVLVSLLTCLFVVSISSMAGFAFGTKKFPGDKILFFALLATMFLPPQVMFIPLFLWVRTLHLTDTLAGVYFAMALPMIASPFGIFLVKQFAGGIPRSIIEAATIDGASERQIFLKIALPLLAPSLATLAIFTFNASWNNFMWQSILSSERVNFTIPVGVSYIARTPAFGKSVADIGLMMAGGTFGAFFMVLFFILFQRYFVKGITSGSVKE